MSNAWVDLTKKNPVFKTSNGIRYFENPCIWEIGNTKIGWDQLEKYKLKFDLSLKNHLEFGAMEHFVQQTMDGNYAPHPSYSDEIEEVHETLICEFFGRHCYMSFNDSSVTKSHMEYMQNIINRRDFSLLEHFTISFIIRGVSRGLTHELVRHRHLSPSQLSTRYVDEKWFYFVLPPMEKDLESFTSECAYSLSLYKRKLQEGIARLPETMDAKTRRKTARGFARQYLPHCLEAPICLTGNARAWREMLEKRYDPQAETEIYNLAKLLTYYINEKYPAILLPSTDKSQIVVALEKRIAELEERCKNDTTKI